MKDKLVLLTAASLILSVSVAKAGTVIKSKGSGNQVKQYNMKTGSPVGHSYQKRQFETVEEVAKFCGNKENNKESVCTAFDFASTYSMSISSNKVTLGAGNLNLSFDPTQLDCIQGAHLDFSMGNDNQVNTTLSPSCDDILGVSFAKTFSHTFTTPPFRFGVPIYFVTLGVQAIAAATVGIEYKAGAVVGGFRPDADGMYVMGNKRPDYVYAQATPFVSGNLSAGVYAGVFEPFCEFGVEGNVNLITMNATGRVETGIAYNDAPYGYDVSAYVKGGLNAGISAGSGGVFAYKKFFGFKIFNQELFSWPAIYSERFNIWNDRITYPSIKVDSDGMGDDY
jgi:hypothetical protein